MLIIAHNQHITNDPSTSNKDREGVQQKPSIRTQPIVNEHIQVHEFERP